MIHTRDNEQVDLFTRSSLYTDNYSPVVPTNTRMVFELGGALASLNTPLNKCGTQSTSNVFLALCLPDEECVILSQDNRRWPRTITFSCQRLHHFTKPARSGASERNGKYTVSQLSPSASRCKNSMQCTWINSSLKNEAQIKSERREACLLAQRC